MTNSVEFSFQSNDDINAVMAFSSDYNGFVNFTLNDQAPSKLVLQDSKLFLDLKKNTLYKFVLEPEAIEFPF